MGSQKMLRRRSCIGVVLALCLLEIGGFTWSHVGHRKSSCRLHLSSESHQPHSQVEASDGDRSDWSNTISRREVLSVGIATSVLGTVSLSAQAASDVYKQAKRPFAYAVDTTIPPTLLPLDGAQKENAVLKALGRGSGSPKEVIVDDSINLNNILQKAVFGTIDAVSSLTGSKPKDESKSGPGYASFVCLGVPKDTQAADIDLAVSLLSTIVQSRRSGKPETALGLSFAPLSTQDALDQYTQNGNLDQLRDSLTKTGVSTTTIDLYAPLLSFAKSLSIPLLALAPEEDDVRLVRKDGLQSIDPDRRSRYVIDSQGFIALTQDPKFRLYADRSLLKDYEAKNDKDQQGNFFAERILVHEAAATAVAQYAASRPDSLVALVAPIPDLRFLGGINGRIARVCQFLNPDTNKVTDNAVTTILLNPTAKETLSLSRFLRLEIGTGPETLDYQTKVADYLWFSTMPKVNMLPRLMNPR